MVGPARLSSLVPAVLAGAGLLLGAAAPGARAQSFRVPDDLSAARCADAARSFLCLCADGRGGLLASTEDGGIRWLRDGDGDGFLERDDPWTELLTRVQGLCLGDDCVWAVGGHARVNGRPRVGLWRVPLDPIGRAGEPELVLPFESDDEHGAHAVAVGTDGFLYLSHGDLARPLPPPARPLPEEPARVLPPLEDPSGYGARARWPYGGVVRVDPSDGSWTQWCHGLRNPYDLVRDAEGEWFTADADMEWDVGMPTYRPVRVALAAAGSDHGWRAGSDPRPSWSPEVLPPVVELGRGSPTGLLLTDGLGLPAEWDGHLLVGDWQRGAIDAVRLVPVGAGWTGERREWLVADGGLPVTDLVARPGGGVWFCTGGRGQLGGVYAVTGYAARDAAGDAGPDPGPAEDGPSEDGVSVDGVSVDGGGEDGAPGPRDERAARRARRRSMELPTRTSATRAEVLGEPADAFELAARRRFLPAHVGGRDVSGRGLLHKNRWWPQWKFADPRLRDAQDSQDLVNFLWVDVPADLRLQHLRAAQLVLSQEPPLGARFDERFGPNLDHRLGQLAADPDPRVGRLAAELLARRAPRTAPEVLLGVLEGTDDRERALHAARCLTALVDVLDGDRRARFLAFFEEASGWSGGASFPGWLQGMLDAAVDAAPAGELVERADALGPRALATAVARRPEEEAAALAPALERAFEALAEDVDAGPAALLERRRAVLRALLGARVPALAPWLRRVAEAEPALAGDALLLLAPLDDPADRERCGAALLEGRHDVREAAAASLLRQEPAEPDPGFAAAVLELARTRGTRVALHPLRVLAHRTGRPVAEVALDPDGALAGFEAWFAATYPDFEPPRAGPEDGPPFELERALGFLERSAARPGSAARGARVWDRLGCAACHGIGARASAGTLGPDLTDVGRRFDRAGLVTSIALPSRDVPDRWRAQRAVTADGEWIEGRLVEETPERVLLMQAGGVGRWLERDDLLSLGPSERSPMPEGLLDDVSLEELKDLVAFLDADGRVDPAAAAEPGWVDLLADEQRGRWTGDLAGWRLLDGVLEGSAAGLERNRYLVFDRPWTDFELEFDVTCPVHANSGVQYRSTLDPERADPVGYQADVGQEYWGAVYATDGRGKLAGPEREALRHGVRWEGWNHVHLRVEGDRHVLELNGRVTAELTDDRHPSGVLAFQLHQGLDMQVWFAHVRVRPLR